MDLAAVVVFLATLRLTAGLNNGLSLTPNMGYNSWNSFGSDISEQLMLQQANYMVNMSLVKLGYKTIVLDGARNDRPTTLSEFC